MEVAPVPLNARTVSKLWQLAVRKEVETSSRAHSSRPPSAPAGAPARARKAASAPRSAGGGSEAGGGRAARGPSWTSALAPPPLLAPPAPHSPAAVRVTRPRSVTLTASAARARRERAAAWQLPGPAAAAFGHLLSDPFPVADDALLDACNALCEPEPAAKRPAKRPASDLNRPTEAAAKAEDEDSGCAPAADTEPAGAPAAPAPPRAEGGNASPELGESLAPMRAVAAGAVAQTSGPLGLRLRKSASLLNLAATMVRASSGGATEGSEARWPWE